HPILPQSIIQRGFKIGAFFSHSNNQRARHLIFPSRKFFGITSGNYYGTFGHISFYFYRVFTSYIYNFCGGSKHYISTQNSFLAHTNTFNNNTARTNKSTIFNNNRRSLKRLQYAANAHATT